MLHTSGLYVSEVQMLLTGSPKNKVRAFLTVIFNRTLIVSNMKLISADEGIFLDMPSRALGDHCSSCGMVTEFRHKYCHFCGRKLAPAETRCTRLRPDGSPRLYVSTTFPCDDTFRACLEDIVFHVYTEALRQRTERARMYFNEHGQSIGNIEPMQTTLHEEGAGLCSSE